MSPFQTAIIEDRLQIEYLLNPDPTANRDDGQEAIAGLTRDQKSLPPRYFYDRRGSQLFEQICQLPEYYLTRTEVSLLEEYAAEIAQITGTCELIELGSGNSQKTRLLLDAYQNFSDSLRYLPIDISANILEESAKRLLLDYPSLQIQGWVSPYELALEQLAPALLPARTIFFLGSTLGNLDRQDCDRFFSQITAALEIGDYFLLGIDLQKPKAILEAAYNDNQGLTAAFNLNMLQHLNERFRGNFDLSSFQHWAFYNPLETRIEMHLISQRSQSVRLDALDLTVAFAAGETILTEISRKFDLAQMQQYLEGRRLKPLRVWSDPQQWFGLLLCQVY